MAIEVARRRFTVEEYYRMVDAGILGEDDRVELVDGEILEMSPIGDRHVESVNRCTRIFARAVGDRALVSVQNPVHLDGYNDPQPDVVLMRPEAYGAPHPADVLLLIEVAETSQDYDRRTKLPLYARAGIGEVWLLDLKSQVLEVHRAPGLPGYAVVRLYRRGERVAPEALPDLEIRVDDILPGASLEGDAVRDA